MLFVSWRKFQKHVFCFCLSDYVPETSEDNAQAFPICSFSWDVWGPVAREICGVSSLKSVNNTEASRAQTTGATKERDWIMPAGSV